MLAFINEDDKALYRSVIGCYFIFFGIDFYGGVMLAHREARRDDE